MSLCIHRKKKKKKKNHIFLLFIIFLIFYYLKSEKKKIFQISDFQPTGCCNRPLKSQSIVFLFSNREIVLEQHILMKDNFFSHQTFYYTSTSILLACLSVCRLTKSYNISNLGTERCLTE